LNLAPEPRLGFEMTLLRMLAFRPDAARQHASPATTSAAASTGSAPAGASAAPLMARPAGIDAGNWAAVVEAANLGGMVRQLALNCVPGGFEREQLKLRLDQAAADRRTSAIEEKLAQGLSKYFGRDIRLVFEASETSLDSPARQRAQAEQDKAARAASAFEADPAVKGLRERFGADVDLASVKPAN
jgi:DNA polymerase III subunit gamma/tau